jgi:hypothetical protein
MENKIKHAKGPLVWVEPDSEATRSVNAAEELIIIPDMEGSREYSKVSFPIRYGRYAQITYRDYNYQFNCNGELKFIQGRTPAWPANEWLKRTVADDWVYYSTEGYNSVFSLFGEYYLPCFSYSQNSISAANPFQTGAVAHALDSVTNLFAKIALLDEGAIPHRPGQLINRVRNNDTKKLGSRAVELHKIIGGPLTVLPPDTRHVDYDVIPIVIADGCLYNCGFCSVKTGRNFSARNRQNIVEQIEKLKEYYGPDLVNYNSIFLGGLDALQAGPDLIEFASEKAYEMLHLGDSLMKGANLFFFGSVNSLLSSSDDLFRSLNETPFITYVNVGLESADRASLEILEKPLTPALIQDAFRRLLDVNRRFGRIELTANFVIGSTLPENHERSIIDLVRSCTDRRFNKGTLYFSPMDEGKTVREVREKIYRIKNNSRLPAYCYLIQRL